MEGTSECVVDQRVVEIDSPSADLPACVERTGVRALVPYLLQVRPNGHVNQGYVHAACTLELYSNSSHFSPNN